MKEKRRDPIQLSDHFTFGRLIRFVLPSILMMVFMSIYTVIDGLFISNYAGKVPFTAINLIWPPIMIVTSVGFMYGAGGSALIGKLLGEGKEQKAKEVFTMVVVASVVTGAILGGLGVIFSPQIATWMGAEGEIHTYAVKYGRWLFAAMPFAMLQYEFQGLCNTAEKPLFGMLTTIAAGCMNIVLDGIFVGAFNWGLDGAAAATVASQAVGGIIPIIYFARKNPTKLRLCKYKTDFKALGRVVGNGSSELLTNIAMSVVSILYNHQLLKLIGENGVAAYGVIAYLLQVFSAVFMGFAVATSPITSFNLGAKNQKEMRSVLAKSLIFIACTALVMVALAEGLAGPLSKLFFSYDDELYSLTKHAFRISSFQFAFMGIAMFGSSYFTALNNGLISAVIAFLRTLIFQVAFVYLMPLIWGADGIWASLIGAELVCSILVIVFLLAFEKKYGYGFWKKHPKEESPKTTEETK